MSDHLAFIEESTIFWKDLKRQGVRGLIGPIGPSSFLWYLTTFTERF
jgi:hypothetical protein